jgi:hypothetical protein
MDAINSTMTSPGAAALFQGRATSSAGGVAGLSASSSHKEVRAKVGEFVGSIFYGTLLREAQKSTLKGKYMHGGRGEEVFKGQLNEELARKLGRSQNNPITDRLSRSIERRLARSGNAGVSQQAGPLLSGAAAVGAATEGAGQ